MTKANQIKKVKQVAAVLGSAVAGAFLLAALMIYRYNPSGRYTAGNAILDPSVMEQINVSEFNSAIGGNSRFTFQGSEFSYFDKTMGQRKEIAVDPASYAKFYNRVASIISIEEPSAELIQRFNKENPATLSSTIRSDKPANAPAVKVLQVIQFSEPDYFRVQLKGEGQADEWAYFFHPGVYNQALQFFSSQSP